MKKGNLKGSLILLTASLIWGLAFVAQNIASEKAPSFTINALRSFIAAAVLYIFYLLLNIKSKEPFIPKEKEKRLACFKGGIICGSALAVSANLQQFGIAALKSANAKAIDARSGFLTALYVILVPIISVLLRKRVNFVVWISVFAAVAGVYLLCFEKGMEKLYLGDLLLLLCAVSFSIHILTVDKYVGTVGGIRLSVLQFAVCGILSAIGTFVFDLESITLVGIVSVMPQIIYLGVMSSGVAYTLQVVGQKFAEPAVASISMSFESVFAALGGWLISGDALNKNQIIGCALVFAAIILPELPEFVKKNA